MKIVTVEIACKDKDTKYIQNELLNLDLGIYNFGTSIRKANKQELAEIKSQVPDEILNPKKYKQ